MLTIFCLLLPAMPTAAMERHCTEGPAPLQGAHVTQNAGRHGGSWRRPPRLYVLSEAEEGARYVVLGSPPPGVGSETWG